MARPEAPGGTVSQAVREHLRQLCLREFPCGTGSWNESRFLPQTWRTWRELVPREEEAAKAGEETEEALLGLVRSPHSPWARLGELSAQDSFLRELAIRNPLMLKDTFFYSYFKSLRVVNKAVSLVDRDLLKFKKLEELVLSANRIKEVDAANLPPTLKVLELYGNEVTSMACLCAQPPPGLQHLGLGHNKLQGPMESQHVTTSHWPGLVSLDLGFNNLLDLQGMVGSLRSLRQLRLLVLQGNPLALVPYYRGFTIDSLARLCVLDDITVSPHEKHQFRGLGLSGDLLPREAQLVVTIGNVTGVLDSSVLDPEPGPEGPFITYSYYVTYDFVEDEEGEGNEYGGVLAQIVKPSSPSTEMPPEEGSEEAGESLLESPLPESGELEESVASAGPAVLPSDSAEELAKLRPRIDPRLCPSPGDGSLQHPPQALGGRHQLQLRDAAHPPRPGAAQGLPAGGDHRDRRGGEDPLVARAVPRRGEQREGERRTRRARRAGRKKGEKDKKKGRREGQGTGGRGTLRRSGRRPRRRRRRRGSCGRTRPCCRCWATARWCSSPCSRGEPLVGHRVQLRGGPHPRVRQADVGRMRRRRKHLKKGLAMLRRLGRLGLYSLAALLLALCSS
ncbi:leucine-rich repeat-containing protein 43 [Dasypus novemcinctus]|uniref:leucine-rich repeat-containing protein 43 n=1 Tax=Dasypus novemcinctus TaxID=9361 RepID=UPI0039C97199